MEARRLFRTLFVATQAIMVSAALAGPPDSLWSRTYGGTGSQECYTVQQTADSGYIMAGRIGPSNNYSFWLVKADSDGDSLWSNSFGGDGGDICQSVQQTADGSYILAGWTDSFGAGQYDFWLVQADENGDSVWSRTYGGGGWEYCYCVQQTSDDGYMLVGDTWDGFWHNGWVVKTNSDGDSLWSRSYGGADDDHLRSGAQTSDGGYILAGYTFSYGAGQSDFWLIKTDSAGITTWSRTYGGISSEHSYAVQEVRVLGDHGFVLAGDTYSFGAGQSDFWIVRTNANGDSLWAQSFGGASTEICYAVQFVSTGFFGWGYMLAGYTSSFGAGNNDFWLVKVGMNADSMWSCTFGAGAVERCLSAQQTFDAGYIMAGKTNSFGGGDDFWLVKTGPDWPVIACEPVIRIAPYPLRTGNAVLYWPPVDDATTYSIYGSEEPFIEGELLDSVSDTTWTDPETSSRPSRYLYYVMATD